MDVVYEISVFGGEFLRSKFVHDLWPVLKVVVQRERDNTPPGQAQVEKNKYSMKYRFTVKMLECLSQLCSCMDLPPNTLSSIVSTCKYLLGETQPHDFQKAALQLYKNIIEKNNVDDIMLSFKENFYSPNNNNNSNKENAENLYAVENVIQEYKKNVCELMLCIQQKSIKT